MAIYHLSMKPVQRGVCRSATAAAAYRAGAVVREEQTGLTFDYTRKTDVVHTEIVIPTASIRQDVQWPYDRNRLWNTAESAERRRDARVAREWELALPVELSRAQRLALTREFAQELAERYGCAVDVAIHGPGRGGDARNHHAHLLATTRTIEPGGLGRKTDIELGDTDRRKKGLGCGADELKEMRGRWAALTNAALASAGQETRVDHRSLAAQGIARSPGSHFGPAVVEMERRGVQTEVVTRTAAALAQESRILESHVRALSAVRQEIERVESRLIDLTTTLAQAKAERRPVTNADAVAKQAIDQWQALRAKTLAQEKANPPQDPLQQWLAWRKEQDAAVSRGAQLSFEDWQQRQELRAQQGRDVDPLLIEQTMAQEREERLRRAAERRREHEDDYGM